MTAPDPRNPQVGDVFVRQTGDEATVTAIGRNSLLFVECDGEERTISLDTVAKFWTPKPEPLITGPMTLYQGPETGIWYRTTGIAYAKHWPTITILPDHTWIEGTP